MTKNTAAHAPTDQDHFKAVGILLTLGTLALVVPVIAVAAALALGYLVSSTVGFIVGAVLILICGLLSADALNNELRMPEGSKAQEKDSALGYGAVSGIIGIGALGFFVAFGSFMQLVINA